MFEENGMPEFIIHRAAFAAVGPEWSKRVFPYPHHRLYYVTGGEAVLRLRDTELTLTPGYVYLLPSFSLVEAVCRESLSHYYLHFQESSGAATDLFEFSRPRLCAPADGMTRGLFEAAVSCADRRDPASILRARGALLLLLAPFFSGLQEPEPAIRRFSPAVEYIRRHFQEKIAVKTLADIMKLDPVYFSNSFSRAFGMPPSRYLIKIRLEAAQRLLTLTDKKLREIASSCGFESEMYFSRRFRQETGMTPGEYRRM